MRTESGVELEGGGDSLINLKGYTLIIYTTKENRLDKDEIISQCLWLYALTGLEY